MGEVYRWKKLIAAQMEVSVRIKGIACGVEVELCSQGIKEYGDPDNIGVPFVIIHLYNKAHELE